MKTGREKELERELDPYRRRAAEIFGVSPKDVTKEQRAYAKAQCYTVAYGVAPQDDWWITGQPLTGKRGAECKDGWDA